MKKDIISVGSHISTLCGEMVVTLYNGSIVYLDEYEIDEDDELVLVGERALTLNEIACAMREVDGQNHKVIFEEV